MPDPSRLYLIDGHALIYRAFFGIPSLTNSKGFPTNAVFGFATMLMRIIREHRPDFLAVAFDSKGPTKRHEEFEDYKADRPEMPDLLQPQIPVIHRLVEALSIPVIIKDGYEADDLIGTLVRMGEEREMDITIVSGDKDMFQLISPRVRVYDSMKNKTFGEAEIFERFGVKPSQVIEIMGLMGDKIDNIPGIPGVGEKTAVTLIKRFGSIENLISRVAEIEKPKLRENIRRNAEQARLSLSLVTIDRHCPIKPDMEELRLSEPDTAALTDLLREMEFTSLLRQFEPDNTLEATITPFQISSETTAKEFVSYCAKQKNISLSFETIVTAPEISTLAGVGLASGKKAAFIRLYNPDVKNPLENLTKIRLKWIKPLLENPKIRKVVHDLKSVLKICRTYSLPWAGPASDTMIMSYLLNPNRRDHSLGTEALSTLGTQLPKIPLDFTKERPWDLLAQSSGIRTASLIKLDKILTTSIAEQNLSDLYHKTELPLAEVLAGMEQTGIKIDVDILTDLSKEVGGLMEGMTQKIHSLAGTPFNLNSPKQLSDVLFNRLGLKPIKRTKTGFSTNEEVLQQLALHHELPAEILGYRQLSKLKSTYLDALPRLVNKETSRLHTSFNQTVAATGRLSSSDPNLQNIPIKGDWGRRIREAFIPEPGKTLLSADYNQVELRILAHLSGDEALRAAFKSGEDIHTKTAEQIFGLKSGAISAEMRRTAKSVNFGIVYGISPYGLSSTLGISQVEAKEYIDRYFEHFKGVRRFMDETIREAKEKGYVTTIFSRRRPIPELSSSTPALRALGERTALNTPIQGGAADLIKAAMIGVYQRLKKEGLSTRMLLQIHDELIFEVPEKELDPVKNLVREEMEGAVSLNVPLKIDLGVGKNWAEAHG